MGTQRHADDYPLLKQLAITHVVNCAGSRLTAPLDECVPAELYPQEVGIKECMVVGALDHGGGHQGVHGGWRPGP